MKTLRETLLCVILGGIVAKLCGWVYCAATIARTR